MVPIVAGRLIARKWPVAVGHTTKRDPIAIGPTKYDEVWRRWLIAGRSTARPVAISPKDIKGDPIANGLKKYDTHRRGQVNSIRKWDRLRLGQIARVTLCFIVVVRDRLR